MTPNLHWSEVYAEQTFHQLIDEGKLVEIGSGKFKPIDDENCMKRRNRQTDAIIHKADFHSL
jgi:hypothetical protein